MSEDFDKEAERKRLREKYEAEREDREATERMSELLLKGATMTNKHCEVCGSPIFRYQGQEFCPSCQEERSGKQAAQEAGAQQGQQAGQPAAGESATTAEQADTGEARSAHGTASPGSSETTESPSAPEQQPAPTGAGPQTPQGPVAEGAGTAPAQGTIEDARAALVRTLTNLSRRAEQTDDPRQAKELLAAAKEAADTLSRLRGN